MNRTIHISFNLKFVQHDLGRIEMPFLRFFSLKRHFLKHKTAGDFPAHGVGATVQTKKWYRAKRHLSRPTSSFAYLACGAYRVIFVGRSNRKRCFSRRERKVTGPGSLSLGAEGNAAARCATPMSVISYPKTGARQIVSASALCVRARSETVIITSVSLMQAATRAAT